MNLHSDTDGIIWITIGSDAIPLLYDAGLIRSEPEFLALDRHRHSTVISTTSSDLEKIDQILHAVKGIGGYTVHSSEAEAIAYNEKMESPRETSRIARYYTIDNAQVANYLANSIIQYNLVKTINELSTSFKTRYYSTNDGKRASEWLKTRWRAITLQREDIDVDAFEHDPTVSPQPSVVATIEGNAERNSVVILGAHIDSTARGDLAPGMDDNASGVSILTELLRVIVQTGYKPDKTILVIGYAAEEVGLRGSRDIASFYAKLQDVGEYSKEIVGALNLDMSCYYGSKEDIYIIDDYTDPAQNQFLANLITTYLKDLTFGFTTCGYACSDHSSWYAENVPASFAFESRFHDLNPKFHTSYDNRCDKNHILKFARLAAVYVAELAKGKLSLTKGKYN